MTKPRGDLSCLDWWKYVIAGKGPETAWKSNVGISFWSFEKFEAKFLSFLSFCIRISHSEMLAKHTHDLLRMGRNNASKYDFERWM